MRALYTTSPAVYTLQDIPKPCPGFGEVLIKVDSVAICHTDINIKHGKSPAVRYPCVPGHEFSGTVEKCGEGTGLVPGARGSVQTIIACHGCPSCRLGKPMRCENFDELGLKRNGGFAQYCVIPARNFMRIPDNLSLEEAALTEPLANAVTAVRRVSPGIAKNAVIIGPGPIGLLACGVLSLFSPANLVMFGTRDERLRIAKSFGATDVVNIRLEDGEKALLRLLAGKKADIVIDCSGSIHGFALSLKLVAPGGGIVYEGLVGVEDTIPFSPAMLQSNCGFYGIEGWCPEDFQTAADLIATGKIDVKPLITHTMPLTQWEEGFRLAETKADGAIKVILKPSL